MPGLFRALSLAALFAAAASSAWAQSVDVEVVDYGLYEADAEPIGIDPNGIERQTLRNICHIATRSTVPALDGVLFGFRYRLLGREEGAAVRLHLTVRFPHEMKPPSGPRPLAELSEYRDIKAQIVAFEGYSLDYAWEKLLGRWRMELSHAGRLLIGRDFDVVAGAAGQTFPKGSNCLQVSSLRGTK